MSDPDSSRPASAPPAHPDRARVPLAIEDWLTVIIMALLALITFVNVLVRYFTDASFAWTEEVSVFLMIALAMVASSAAVARGRHIRIEFFADRGSEARQQRLHILGAGLVAFLFALMTVLSMRLVWDDIQYGETSPGIGVPQWWYSMWLPIISLAIMLRAIGVMRRKGRPVHEGPVLPHGPQHDGQEQQP